MVHHRHVIGYLVEIFYEKELQKPNQIEPRVEKVIKKLTSLFVIWKGYDNSFNSWIVKKM